jgi:hypothetical protein
MRAYVLAFHVATSALAGELHYWGVHQESSATGVIELDRQLLTVRAGDVIPNWGRVHAVEAAEIVVARSLSDDEQDALAAHGHAVYHTEHLHIRNVQMMLPQLTATPR